MKPLYTEEEFAKARGNTRLPCECYYCGKIFYKEKKRIVHHLKNDNNTCKYCSLECTKLSKITKIIVKCANCGIEFHKILSQLKKSKSGNNFCSSTCAATFNNKYKINGCRRSKLEQWLEIKLKELYPNIEILFNNKTIINSELDIYIPSLKLAFELNGIFHYEPIYGQDKLEKIQNNDHRKYQACIEQNIELCIIDSSQEKYFKEKSSEKYLNIIIKIINNKLSQRILDSN
jgi:DNA-binding XRE family transcriptional regulator